MVWNRLAERISRETGQPFLITKHSTIAGGCINSAYSIESESKSYFVKFNSANKLSMFEAEFDGLIELAKADAIRVPAPVCTGILEQQSYIVMESLNLNGAADMSKLAEQLVKLHRYRPSSISEPQFGWWRDNTIGSILQKNTLSDNSQSTDWQTFWNNQRLGFQLELARQKGANKALLDKGERIQADLDKFFTGYEPEASLLHGDLWSGNVAFSNSGEPVIFDPAIYFGDREADIAMTELFGGFSAEFYRRYQQLWPLDDGYKIRKHLYNLYHILNHYNMFGGGYGSQADSICSRLLANI